MKTKLNPFNRHLFFVPNGDNALYNKVMSTLRRVGIPHPTIFTEMKSSNGQVGLIVMYRCLPCVQQRFIKEMTMTQM